MYFLFISPTTFLLQKSWVLFNYKVVTLPQLQANTGNKNTRSAGNTPGAVQRYIIPDTTYRLHFYIITVRREIKGIIKEMW